MDDFEYQTKSERREKKKRKFRNMGVHGRSILTILRYLGGLSSRKNANK